MKKVDLLTLKEAANNLLFDMSDDEDITLLNEFDTIISQIELINKIDGIDEAIPMSFPYEIYTNELREDIPDGNLTIEEALKNSSNVVDGMIKLPKVVG